MNPPKPALDDLRIERSSRPKSSSRFWPVAIGLAVLVLAVGTIWWLKQSKVIAVRTVLVREATGYAVPRFRCAECGGQLAFDEIPERYFSFLT